MPIIKSFYQRQEIDTNALDRWRKQLSARQRAVTQAIAKETLTRLGYAPTTNT